MRPSAPEITTIETIDTEIDTSRVLFIGQGDGGVCWYRHALPATALGADWVGVMGEPPNMQIVTGLVKRETQLPDWQDYDIIVIGQPRGRAWLTRIRELQRAGKKVVYELDDHVHAIRKLPPGEHDWAHRFTAEHIKAMELVMGVCDAMIVSTPFLAKKYARYARKDAPIFVCRNGVDVARYDLTLPERDYVALGWAGGTGHHRAVAAWLPSVARVLRERPQTRFVTIGQSFASALAGEFPDRVMSIPFSPIDTYPAAMTNIDIALAPAHDNGFTRGKSDLRWVEASALGIPTIADPRIYPEIIPQITGMWAYTPEIAYGCMLDLVDYPQLRREIGENARAHVRMERDMHTVAHDWSNAFTELLDPSG